MRPGLSSTFRSLRNRNYRIWAAGALVSNIGTWMQRIAQDWVVLSELTDHNATAVGVVMALQFGPQVALLPFTGWAADRFDRRRLLIATQTGMGLLALALGLLMLSGQARLWQVQGLALLQGCVTAFDATARHTFVAELVGEDDLSNAVALNSTSFNSARMIGPALAGVLIGRCGSGWVFLLNALSFVAVVASLLSLRSDQLHRTPRSGESRRLRDGLSYVRGRPDLSALMLIMFLVGTFGLNFPIFISTMAVRVYGLGAGAFGLVTSVMAIGSVTAALGAAGRQRPTFRLLCGAGWLFGVGCAAAAAMPNYAAFAVTLALVGVAAQTLTISATSLIQLSTSPAMRGRVTALFLTVTMGGTPLGAPLVGWVADHFGPRQSLLVGAAAGCLAALVAGLTPRAEESPGEARVSEEASATAEELTAKSPIS